MSEIKLYPVLYPIRYLLGAVGGALLVVALTWSDAPLKSRILAAIAGLVLITVTFALKHEHLKRRKLLENL